MAEDVPAFLIRFLYEALQWAMTAPEHGQDKGVHVYLSKVEVICEGEVIGHLINDDPEWVFRGIDS